MRKLLIFFFTFLFSCNTTNFNTAYKDYYKNQRIYIEAILDNNRQKQINSLKELIQCGKYLHFDVSDYENKLKKLLPKKEKKSTLKKHYKKSSKKEYIRIISFNPLKIKTSKPYKTYTIKENKLYKQIIDIKNAIIAKPFIKKTYKNYKVKIAQFNKSTVRIVFYSPKKFKLKIKKNKNILNFIINNKKYLSHINHNKKNILSKQQKQTATLFKRKIIVIDPGHGGKDSGGIGIGGRKEKIAVLQIAKYLKYYLQKEGYIVYMTRNKDIFKTLKYRTHFANLHHADLFISIHCNISPNHIKSPHGIETYFLSPARSQRAIRVAKLENKEISKLNYLDQRVILNFLNRDKIIASNKFGIDVQSHMLMELRKKYKNVIDGGVRPAPFWVLVGTQMPAILIETGFLTNPMEAKRLFNPDYQKRLAKGIANGVKAYFIKNSK